MDLIHLSNIAINAARAAGQVIKAHMKEEVLVEHKVAGSSYASQVVTVVDKACETEILDHLMPTCKKHSLAIAVSYTHLTLPTTPYV